MERKAIRLSEIEGIKVDAEVTADRVLFIKNVDGRTDYIGLDIDELEKVLEEMKAMPKQLDSKQYINPKMGVSAFSGERVKVFGEQTIQKDGKIMEQYLYDIVGHTPANGLPFASLKSNIILD